MIEKRISLPLPAPWKPSTLFETYRIGQLNFLVGPNGSGKSRFAQELIHHLPSARLLGTDRLSGMEQHSAFRDLFGDHMAAGISKSHFNHFKLAGHRGAGLDALILLEERIDIRIKIEATLSHLFNRKISLDWDSGNLQAKAIIGTDSYRLDRDECHGIKELFVLLTHLYNDENLSLIIDEPELNLHPQYQAFFMQEIRKQTDTSRKIVFLVTHSPFILDFKTVDDVKSVISFSSDHSTPKALFDLDEEISKNIKSLVPRLNVHHKQLFFSDNPIFVEGILDSQFIETLQRCSGVSAPAAGSCIIDVGGCEESNKYLELCKSLEKKAHFVYDIDSLFSGTLRQCIKGYDEVQSLLASAGVSGDFSKYCGELDAALTRTIDELFRINTEDSEIEALIEHLKTLGDKKSWDRAKYGKARVATITAISRHKGKIEKIIGEQRIQEIQGRLRVIAETLDNQNIHLLTGGTLERYLPSYEGNFYALKDEQKRKSVLEEITHLSGNFSEHELAQRYGELFKTVQKLPSKKSANIDTVLHEHLSLYIHKIQNILVQNIEFNAEQINSLIASMEKSLATIFSMTSIQRYLPNNFHATIRISEKMYGHERFVHISHMTNAGMRDYKITDS
jgi:hypothetical protein